VDAEELLAVANTVTVGIEDGGIGTVDVQLVAIRDPVAIGVRIGGIQAKIRLEVVGLVVRVLIGRAGDRRVGRVGSGGGVRRRLRCGSHILGDWRRLWGRGDHGHPFAWVQIAADDHLVVGGSGDGVYRLQHPGGGPELYLKHASGPTVPDVIDEMARLRWLARHVTVPAVRFFLSTADEAWLLMTALPGQTATQRVEASGEARRAIVDSLADFLRRLHAIPVETCPFNSDHRLRLSEARWRLDRGLVDPTDFDEARRGWTGEQVWDAVSGLLPIAPDPVVTHGDLSLDNILVADDGRIGCIDTGRTGIADRYQDLAIVWRGLGDFGPALQARFLERYGIDRPDSQKIEFYLMLDELF